MARDYPLARMAMRAKLAAATAKFKADALARKPGRYTATDTGAKQLARLRAETAEGEELVGSITDTKKSEDYISGKRKKGK